MKYEEGNLYTWGYNYFALLGNGYTGTMAQDSDGIYYFYLNKPTKIMNGTKFEEIDFDTTQINDSILKYTFK